jgi:hypothetical protein
MWGFACAKDRRVRSTGQKIFCYIWGETNHFITTVIKKHSTRFEFIESNNNNSNKKEHSTCVSYCYVCDEINHFITMVSVHSEKSFPWLILLLQLVFLVQNYSCVRWSALVFIHLMPAIFLSSTASSNKNYYYNNLFG